MERDSGRREPKQVGQYDKVLKENIEVILPGLMKNVIGLEAAVIEGLPEGIQHTRERRPAMLRKVTDKMGKIFVLHIEFQTKDDGEMVCRMAEYYIMLWRKYTLPIKQYVIYISEGKPTMAEELRLENLFFRYRLFSLLSVDYRLFLQSQRPEEKIMALLADFGDRNPEAVTEEIVHQVAAAANGTLNGQRYFQQMRILSKLRKLVSLKSSDMLWGDITRYILEETDLTTDPIFQKGEAEGEEIGIAKGKAIGIEEGKKVERAERNSTFVRNLLKLAQFTPAQIADIAEVPEDFVLDMQAKARRRRNSRGAA